MQRFARHLLRLFFALWAAAVLQACSQKPSSIDELAPAAPTGYVTDATGTLTAAEIKAVDSVLRAHEEATTNQIFFLLVPTAGGNEPAALTTEIANRWGVGQEAKDNGVLVALYMEDRYLQIAVGYGLEASITDLETARIREQLMNPRLKKGKVYEAVYAGANALISAANGEASQSSYNSRIPPPTYDSPLGSTSKKNASVGSRRDDDGTGALSAVAFGSISFIVAFVFLLEVTRQIGFLYPSKFDSRKKRAAPVILIFAVIFGVGLRFLYLIFNNAQLSTGARILFGFAIGIMFVCWAAIYPALLMGQAKYLKKRAKLYDLKRIDPFQHGAKYFFALLIWGASLLFFTGGLLSFFRIAEDYWINLLLLLSIFGVAVVAGRTILLIPDRCGVEITGRGSSPFSARGGRWYYGGGASSWGGFGGGGGGFSGGGGGSFGGGGSGGSW